MFLLRCNITDKPIRINRYSSLHASFRLSSVLVLISTLMTRSLSTTFPLARSTTQLLPHPENQPKKLPHRLSLAADVSICVRDWAFEFRFLKYSIGATMATVTPVARRNCFARRL